jgi:hypothetical protein
MTAGCWARGVLCWMDVLAFVVLFSYLKKRLIQSLFTFNNFGALEVFSRFAFLATDSCNCNSQNRNGAFSQLTDGIYSLNLRLEDEHAEPSTYISSLAEDKYLKFILLLHVKTGSLQSSRSKVASRVVACSRYDIRSLLYDRERDKTNAVKHLVCLLWGFRNSGILLSIYEQFSHPESCGTFRRNDWT